MMIYDAINFQPAASFITPARLSDGQGFKRSKDRHSTNEIQSSPITNHSQRKRHHKVFCSILFSIMKLSLLERANTYLGGAAESCRLASIAALS